MLESGEIARAGEFAPWALIGIGIDQLPQLSAAELLGVESDSFHFPVSLLFLPASLFGPALTVLRCSAVLVPAVISVVSKYDKGVTFSRLLFVVTSTLGQYRKRQVHADTYIASKKAKY